MAQTKVQLIEGTASSLFIDSSGRVGIGTASPAQPLTVSYFGSGSFTPTSSTELVTKAGFTVNPDSNGNSAIFSIAKNSDGHALLQASNGSGSSVYDLSLNPYGNIRFNSGFGSSAIAYGCRAWVNFNGTGTVAIRASGNVSSITDNGGTGDWTVNLTTAMPDANFCWTATAENQGPGDRLFAALNAPNTTSTLRVSTYNEGGTQKDSAYVFVSVFR
jgi:hypothetical protein